jgi:uncharacterized protein (UPF0261 family)/Fe-S oxidoreductase
VISQDLVADCVHCGFCLPTCPTYGPLWQEEPHSPRGRIYLMQGLIDGSIGMTETTVEHFDRCLGCLACVTSCPSGVRYDVLIEETRAEIERHHRRPLRERAFRSVPFAVLPRPRLLRTALALTPPRWTPLPARLRPLLDLAPRRLALDAPPPLTRARGEAVARVALLAGCVQRIVFGDVNAATARVLAADGYDVVVPEPQSCCGALHVHAGRLDQALDRARRTIDELGAADTDYIAVNAAGCGSTLKDYGRLLASDPVYAGRAAAFAARVRDVSELLAAVEPRTTRAPLPLRTAFQDSCHLYHGQAVRAEPRRVLASIPEVELVEPAEQEICCGSAGIYNIVKPGPARELAKRKAERILGTRPDVLVSANPGCLLQLRVALRDADRMLPALIPCSCSTRRSAASARATSSPRRSRSCDRVTAVSERDGRTVVLIGTLDTKGQEYAYLRDRVREHGVGTVIVDTGVLGEPAVEADVTREDVARAAGAELAELAGRGDRGAAMEAMGRGAAVVLRRLHSEGRADGAISVGGSGNASIAAQALRELPVGVPKLIVSTLASGDTRPYVGALDVTMTYSVVDIAGINRISARILTNAAAMIAGAVTATAPTLTDSRPLIGATMFGVTTPAVTRARERLEELGYEVIVFHATGSGGQSFEALLADGYFVGALDLTTTELADELVGGVLSAGPDRLEAAGRSGVPQVVSLGALDMVNFGPRETVPSRFADRNLYVHNPTVTLMRTTPEESAELGRRIAAKLNAATAPTVLFVPLGGISTIATVGQPFHDEAADAALIGALRDTLDEQVEVHELDLDINDPAFARAMADRLHELIQASSR